MEVLEKEDEEDKKHIAKLIKNISGVVQCSSVSVAVMTFSQVYSMQLKSTCFRRRTSKRCGFNSSEG